MRSNKQQFLKEITGPSASIFKILAWDPTKIPGTRAVCFLLTFCDGFRAQSMCVQE